MVIKSINKQSLEALRRDGYSIVNWKRRSQIQEPGLVPFYSFCRSIYEVKSIIEPESTKGAFWLKGTFSTKRGISEHAAKRKNHTPKSTMPLFGKKGHFEKGAFLKIKATFLINFQASKIIQKGAFKKGGDTHFKLMMQPWWWTWQLSVYSRQQIHLL